MDFEPEELKMCAGCFFVYSPRRDECPECGCTETTDDDEEEPRCPATKIFLVDGSLKKTYNGTVTF